MWLETDIKYVVNRNFKTLSNGMRGRIAKERKIMTLKDNFCCLFKSVWF